MFSTHLFKFLLIGSLGVVVNLSLFSIFINFFASYVASFLSFSIGILIPYFGHGLFLWETKVFSFKGFGMFYLGYAFSLFINVGIVYQFDSVFEEKIILQIIGISLGSITNYFISKYTFLGRLIRAR